MEFIEYEYPIMTAEEILRYEYPNMMALEEANKVLKDKGFLYLKDFLGARRLFDNIDSHIFTFETEEEEL